MPAHIALLRAVNVGGTGKLPMAELRAMAVRIGLGDPRTYIASGNLVFDSDRSEAEIRSALEAELEAHAGKPVGVLLRTPEAMEAVLAENPFAGAPGNRCVAIFLDGPPPDDLMDSLKCLGAEQVAPGRREIYVHYGEGMAGSKLVIPAARTGTARNLNTIAKLVAMARGA